MSINTKILKKDGKRVEDYNPEKIKRALNLAGDRVRKVLTPYQVQEVISSVESNIRELVVIPVDDLHDIVINSLQIVSPEVAESYRSYRGYKKRFNKTFGKILKGTVDLMSLGDKDNANKNSDIISTKKELAAGIVSKNIALDYELPEDVAKAHLNGDIYSHDLDDEIFGSINCCLFDIENLLRGGYTLNGIDNTEPARVETALSVISDIVLSASSQQFGGFTLPEIDHTLGIYAEKSYNHYLGFFNHMSCAYASREGYEKWVEDFVYTLVKEGYKNFYDHRLNQINNGNGQTSFIAESIGIDTSKWGRLCCKAIIEVRKEGLGENKLTAIFPKIIFLHREGINGNPEDPNYDLKLLAVECSMIRMYPDWLSLDAGYLGEMFDRYGKAISPMGCRAYLSPWYKRGGFEPADENDEPVFIGRANCGAVSLNIPRYAIQSDKNVDTYEKLITHNFWLAIKKHLYKYNKLRGIKASSNPLFFCEGGCHIKLKPDETIEKAIKTFTWSIGYIGLDEASYYMTGKHIHEDNTFAINTLKLLDGLIDEAKHKHHLLFAMYGTPAESLCYKFLQKDREKFGTVKGVTDKEYYTNSFHCNVREHVDVIEKQDIEAPMFSISKGGRIMYNEFPQTHNKEAMIQCINHAMKLGLYYGINLELDTCNNCGHQGEFKDHKCTECESEDIISVNRVCGYLGYTVIDGVNRMNAGKAQEVSERVDHIG